MATYSDDPAYQAYMNALGFNTNEANRQAQDARQRTAEAYDFAQEGLGIDQERSLEGVGANFENRGLVRSGEHERRRAESLRDSNRRFGALELQTSNQYAAIDDALARELAQLELQRASQAYSAAGRAGAASVEGY